MELRLEIGRVQVSLDPAAVSAIRYRAEYGESVVNDLAACETVSDTERTLLRMLRCMIPGDKRPSLLELARMARRDSAFLRKAVAARDALLQPDPRRHDIGSEDGDPFDEYTVLALMAAAGVDMGLIYELPILHLVGVVSRYFESQDAERTDYRKLNGDEMAKLYPR